jgi:hypothetical protein
MLSATTYGSRDRQERQFSLACRGTIGQTPVRARAACLACCHPEVAFVSTSVFFLPSMYQSRHPGRKTQQKVCIVQSMFKHSHLF